MGTLETLGTQAVSQGVSSGTLQALIEEASEAGAVRALERLGLSDPKARRDVDELRELLQAWRDTKAGAAKEAIAWMVRILLALVVLGMVVRLGLLEKVG